VQRRLAAAGRAVVDVVGARRWWLTAAVFGLLWLTRDAHALLGRSAGDATRWLYAALHPLTPSALTWPVALVDGWAFTPIALAVIGAAVAVVETGRTFALGLSAIVLWKLYQAAGHDGLAVFEQQRYLAFVAPLFALLAARGAGALLDVGRERLRPPAQRALLVLLALGTAATLPGHARQAYGRPDPDNATRVVLEDRRRDDQREAHALQALAREHPQCAIAARVVDFDMQAVKPRGWAWRVYGAPLDWPVRIEAAGQSAAEPGPFRALMLQSAPRASCVVVYLGLDCALDPPGDGCADVAPQRAPDWHDRFTSRPWSETTEYGVHTATIDLRAWRLPSPR
jgi:hypothetical protein